MESPDEGNVDQECESCPPNTEIEFGCAGVLIDT